MAITLADAKKQLNIPVADTSDDDELQEFLDDAIEWMEAQVGPLDTGTQHVDDVAGGGYKLVLPLYPVISVDQVQEYPRLATAGLAPTMTLVDGYVYSLDPDTGVVTREDGCRFAARCQVTYTAGRAAIPGPVRRGLLLMVQHAWETQRNAGGPQPMDDGDQYVTGMGFTVPRAVQEWIQPYRLAPAVT